MGLERVAVSVELRNISGSWKKFLRDGLVIFCCSLEESASFTKEAFVEE